MMKYVKVLLGCALMCSALLSCTKEEKKKTLMVGMVTDSGTIDDKSFNQGTWEGIKLAERDLGVTVKYLKPVGTTEADYIKEISNLYDAGYKFIICPGFKFETAVYKAQEKYADAKFVIIDGNAHPADSYEPQCFFDFYIVPHITHFVDADRIFDADLARGHVDVFGVFCITEDEAAL